MREILFRGKRVDGRGWVEGMLIHVRDYCCILPLDCEEYEVTHLSPKFGIIDGEAVPVIPETVGQYTGFVDKFMRKVFEGDIIKTKYGRECIVTWSSSPTYRGWDLKVVDNYTNVMKTAHPDSHDLYANYNLEIVNNIHDIPEELLKGVEI